MGNRVAGMKMDKHEVVEEIRKKTTVSVNAADCYAACLSVGIAHLSFFNSGRRQK